MADIAHTSCECDATAPEDLKLHVANCSLAILKCPWQWREPFLDERRNKLKRKLGDVSWHDPVDPEFIDHLIPGSGKKLFSDVESDELSMIHSEIERLNNEKALNHVSSWDEEDVLDTIESKLMKGSESPNTVAAPMCSREDLEYLDSIFLPIDVSDESIVMKHDTKIISFPTEQSEQPVLQLVTDHYETYLTYDSEELSIGESDHGGLSP